MPIHAGGCSQLVASRRHIRRPCKKISLQWTLNYDNRLPETLRQLVCPADAAVTAAPELLVVAGAHFDGIGDGSLAVHPFRRVPSDIKIRSLT